MSVRSINEAAQRKKSFGDPRIETEKHEFARFVEL